MKSQNQAILSWLKRGYTIDTLRANAKFGCTRLASRIYDLKEMNYKIASKKRKVKNRTGNDCWVSVYYLAK